MTFRPTYGRIWGVSYPLIIAGISETIVEVTDTIFLARYGVTELAAVGLAGAIYAVALFITLGLVDGMQILLGRRAGEGDRAGVGRVFNQGIYLLAISTLVIIALIKFAVPALTLEVFESAEIHAAVNDYLQIAAFGLLFHAFNLAYSVFYVGIARTHVLIGATLVLAVTNIVLDYALIFGNLGLPEMGIAGAGVSSLAAEFAVFLFLTADVLRRRYVQDYGLLRFGRWQGAITRQLAALSTPVSLEALVETARWFLLFLIFERMGETTLAAANVIYSCYVLFLIPVDAFSETVCSLTSNLLGQRRKDELRPFIRRSIVLGYAGVLPLALLSLMFPEQVLSIFTPDEALIELALGGLVVVVLAAFIAVPGDTFYAAVAGTGDTRITFVIQVLVSITTLIVAAVAAFGLGLSLTWVWVAEVAGWALALLLAWLWFSGGAWQRLQL